MDRSAELARVLLRRAIEDQRMFELLADSPEAPLRGIGFHAQQAVEKALKAVLAQQAVTFSKTHNLAQLIDLLRDHRLTVPPDSSKLPQLTPFGVEHRYGLDDLTDWPQGLGTQVICGWVSRTLTWAEMYLQERL